MVTLTDRKWLFIDPTRVTAEQLRGHEFTAKMGYLVYAIMAEGPDIEKTFYLISDDNDKFTWVTALGCRLAGCFDGPPPDKGKKAWEK